MAVDAYEKFDLTAWRFVPVSVDEDGTIVPRIIVLKLRARASSLHGVELSTGQKLSDFVVKLIIREGEPLLGSGLLLEGGRGQLTYHAAIDRHLYSSSVMIGGWYHLPDGPMTRLQLMLETLPVTHYSGRFELGLTPLGLAPGGWHWTWDVAAAPRLTIASFMTDFSTASWYDDEDES